MPVSEISFWQLSPGSPSDRTQARTSGRGQRGGLMEWWLWVLLIFLWWGFAGSTTPKRRRVHAQRRPVRRTAGSGRASPGRPRPQPTRASPTKAPDPRRRPPEGAYPRWWGAVLQAHGYSCMYCGLQARGGHPRLHKEHMVPLSRGGRHHVDNIGPACRHCNLVKGTLTAEEFRAVIAAHGGVPTSRKVRPAARELRGPTQREHLTLALVALQRGDPARADGWTFGEVLEMARQQGCTSNEASLHAVLSTMGSDGSVRRVSRGRFLPLSS